MQIIHALTSQLDGNLEIRNGKRGASFTVKFTRQDAGKVAA
jgi:two-component sensor histidine kinase